MNSIHLRFNFLIFAVFSAALSLGVLAYLSHTELGHYNQELKDSFELTEQLLQFKGKSHSEKTLHDLLNRQKTIVLPQRQALFQELLAAYAGKNMRAVDERARLFAENEKHYWEYLAPLISFSTQKFFYLSLLGCAVTLLGLLLIRAYLLSSVFTPLRELSKKMMDFLNDRYSFEFSVPASNELGELQATFNSLAQRVISNMEELKSLDSAKSEFLSIASHELRTPMTSIKGSLSLLSSGVMGNFNEQTLNLIRIAEAETDRLIRLTNDILDLAKIEAGRMPLNQAWVPLFAVLARGADGLVGLQKAAEVKVKIDMTRAFEVFVDKDRIHQVLTNLIANAIKFSPGGSTVTVSGEINPIPSDGFTVKVTDQGRGISPEDQEMLFQKFRQAASSEVTLVKGTGLGLAIAKALVEEHEGKIGVQSTPGAGSTFYFTLPKWRDPDTREVAA